MPDVSEGSFFLSFSPQLRREKLHIAMVTNPSREKWTFTFFPDSIREQAAVTGSVSA